jgi:hypothetical protein
MKTIKGRETKIAMCKIGDIFSLTSEIELNGDPYLNIIVPQSQVCFTKEHAFNVINLKTGSPRTFNPIETVYVFKRKDIFK